MFRDCIDGLSASHLRAAFLKYLVNSRNLKSRAKVVSTGMLRPRGLAVSSIEHFSTPEARRLSATSEAFPNWHTIGKVVVTP